MNEGPSFSFLSEPSQRNPIGTFNSFEAGSNTYLKEVQGSKGATNPPMSNRLEIVLLLQAAEIQRLTSVLNAYQNKFQQIPTSSKDISFFNQSKNEAPTAQKGSRLRTKMNNESIQSQGQSSIGDISLGSVTDVGLYLQKLQGKYKRALRYVQEHAAARQQLQTAYLEAKEELAKTQQNFQAFKISSIREYQLLRQELDNAKRDQISFEIKQIRSEKQRLLAMVQKEKAELDLEKISRDNAFQQERDRLTAARAEIQRLTAENEEYRKIVERAEAKYRQLLNQKQNAAILSSLEVQRLNSVIKEKTIRLKDIETSLTEQRTVSHQQVGLLKRDLERFKQKNTQLQQELIDQQQAAATLTKEVGRLTSQLREIQFGSQQLITEKRMKESSLQRELHRLNQLFTVSETKYQQQIQEYRLSNSQLTQKLSQTKDQLMKIEETFKNKQFKDGLKIQQLQDQIIKLSRQKSEFIQKQRQIQQENKDFKYKNMQDQQKMKKELQTLINQNRRLAAERQGHEKQSLQKKRISQRQMEGIIAEYEMRLRQQKAIEMELFAQNQSLKVALAQSEKSKNNIMKSRSFEQLFQQIQTLCSSVRQKQSYIQSLQGQISKLTQSASKNLKETLQIRETLVHLLNLFQDVETHRKEDQHSLIQEIRRLFVGQGSLIEELKRTQQQAFYAIRQEKPLVQQYQSKIIDSKDNEIASLREKVNFLQNQAYEKGNLQQIIGKVIALAKENSDLKAAFSLKDVQISALHQQNENIKVQMETEKEKFKIKIEEKEKIERQLRQQFEQTNQVLLQERQSNTKLQSISLEFASLKEYSERELSTRDQLINELKAALKLKNELNSQTSSVFEQQIHKNNSLNQQVKRLRNLLTLESSQKSSAFSFHRKQTQVLKQQVQRLQEANARLENNQFKQVEASQILKKQIKRLRIQIENLTVSQSKLREEIQIKRQECRRCSYLHTEIARIQEERNYLKTQLNIVKVDNAALREQAQRKRERLEYSQKIPILNAQFNRLEQIIETLKQKNSQLVITNHEYEIELQKQENNKQILAVLNQEILRLQSQNIDLVEEVNVYRLEFSQEATQQRQLQENYSLLVLLFVEIQSLRQRIQLKDKQLQQIHKKQLKL